MKIISWNVTGIRACISKGFADFINTEKPDIICLQEIKADEISAKLILDGYEQWWNPAAKKGYSGTVVLSKHKADNSICGINRLYLDEGRIITLSYRDFYLLNCYLPHSQRNLNRLKYKHELNNALIDYVKLLNNQKPIVLCGDLNVAHNNIDLANYKANRGNAGFTEVERDDFSRLLSIGLVDSYRLLYPQKKGAYTWWSYMRDVRKRNIGWRIDYALISKELMGKVIDAIIYSDVLGSDHCPIGLIIDMEMN